MNILNHNTPVIIGIDHGFGNVKTAHTCFKTGVTAHDMRKGRSKTEVVEIICWLTGYSVPELDNLRESDTTYGDFFQQAPQLNPNRSLIKGVVCGVRVEEIEDSLMREVRYLDKLIDELAKGKPMEQILRSQGEDGR